MVHAMKFMMDKETWELYQRWRQKFSVETGQDLIVVFKGIFERDLGMCHDEKWAKKILADNKWLKTKAQQEEDEAYKKYVQEGRKSPAEVTDIGTRKIKAEQNELQGDLDEAQAILFETKNQKLEQEIIQVKIKVLKNEAKISNFMASKRRKSQK